MTGKELADMANKDLTDNFHLVIGKKKTILTCTVNLDRDTMLDALKSKALIINGKYYHVPERRLLEALMCHHFGEMEMEFELMETD